MVNLLKKLFSTRDGNHTVVIINEDGTKPSHSYKLNPINLWLVCTGALLIVAVVMIALFRFTPLGNLVYNQNEIRNSVIAIQQRVASLQDTIEARNIQLNKMQNIIAMGQEDSVGSMLTEREPSDSISEATGPGLQSYEIRRLPADAALISTLLDQAPAFPAPYPVQGTNTRGFNMNIGHYGLDIAATAGASFQAIADGVIISQEWTFNYGYVLVIQHANSILSIYKHAQTIDKATGEAVREGDILGTIGDVGILSSGPHLHIEIWENGIPGNPQNYLIKMED